MTAKFLPMLAVRGEPFDSPRHLFEVKWDGVRAVAAVEGGRWQVWGRDLADYQLRYPELEVLFSGEATGLAVQLPDWTYPVVCETNSGQIRFDNFEGRWGEQKHLDAFLQAYAVEKAKLEARRKGHSTTEQTLPDGSIKLTIHVAGGAV